MGVGAFGRVLLAEVKGLEGKPSTSVAVKMCKDGGDKEHFRAFILELKIMIHLGKHLNIVNLIGAYTSNMVKGKSEQNHHKIFGEKKLKSHNYNSSE